MHKIKEKCTKAVQFNIFLRKALEAWRYYRPGKQVGEGQADFRLRVQQEGRALGNTIRSGAIYEKPTELV